MLNGLKRRESKYAWTLSSLSLFLNSTNYSALMPKEDFKNWSVLLTHKSLAVFSCKVDKNRVSEIRDQSCDHECWFGSHELLVAALTAVPVWLLDHLTTAVFTHTRVVVDTLIILYPGDEAIKEVVMKLIGVVLTMKCVVNLTNQIKVAWFAFFPEFVDHRLLIVALTLSSLAARLYSQICKVGQIMRSLPLLFTEPALEFFAIVVRMTHEKTRMIICSIQTFATEVRNSCSFNSDYLMQVSLCNPFTNGSP